MAARRRWGWWAVPLVLLALVVVAPWLVPTSAWIAPAEEAASKALGAPVKIAGIRLALLPLPHATASGIDVGGGALKVASAAVTPDLGSLFSAPRHLRVVRVDTVFVDQKGIDILQAFAAKPPAVPPPVTIGRVEIAPLEVALPGAKLPPLAVEVQMGAANAPQRAVVKTQDGKATLTALAKGKVWKVDLAAANWTPPAGPPLKFDELKANGRVEGDKLILPAISARLYGGQVTGKAEAAWAKGMRLGGDAKVSGVEIAPVLAALKQKATLSGQLEASGPFSAQAAKPAGLVDAISADFAFNVKNGTLQGFDLANAARNLVKGGSKGGQTRFDQLSGNVKLAGRAVRLSNLRVTSGALDAKGNVDVAASRQLSGRIDVDLKGTAGLVGVPLAVSGTVSDPLLLPTKGALAGAAVGTVLLPGVGTAAGSSIGDKIGKFFGK
ncbi:MAG: AsmA family protein [Burkholderiales bacterium]|nr:AsmA family protein [Burkholderiales bacterium]